MRFNSLLGTTTAVALAVLALAGSFVDASPADARQNSAPSQARTLTPSGNSLQDFRALVNNAIQLVPKFGFIQLEGTEVTQESINQDQVERIVMRNRDGIIAREIELQYAKPSDKDHPIYAIITDYSDNEAATIGSTFFKFKYNQNTGIIQSYSLETPNGHAFVLATPSGNGLQSLMFHKMSGATGVSLGSAEAWDGKSTPVFTDPQA
ncbi:hypothetical protein THASP1DRAFT_33329 [Thamnocephalis sphaerospora]|uniref:Uncharacterized protein n=1 Tax=Thamnocephalis sphaerospora TaxID=78915 RepID=A0A4P9XI17_9FUNG|nr:hypothetical protein THASP1DRAFT_33329 [Thamnocephalis sphaerospora]|eukprot:RKP04860.1 hypothetical protein THASP1DRAFT_33329 [Thamnocephalis sphaerospora]